MTTVRSFFFASFFLASFFLAGSLAFADDSSSSAGVPTVEASTQPITLVPISNKAFKVGEKLEFIIKYQFVGAGTATMHVAEGAPMMGRRTIHIESRAESNKLIDKFFKVRDFNASTADMESMMSWNFHQNLKEGHYEVIRNTSFNYLQRTYKFSRVRKGKMTERTGAIHQPMCDILSAFFYARTLPLEPGKNYSVTVFSDEEIYSLGIKVHPLLQKVNVPAGKFECLRIEPVILGDGIFKAKEGKMLIWMTNDERKMPVLIRSKVMIGAIDAELKSFTPGQ